MSKQDYNDDKIKKELGNKKFIVIICLLILFFMVIGLSITVFIYHKKSNETNKISTGNIYLNYDGESNGINITDAYPVSDETGKTLTDQTYYFDFTVETSIVGDVVADYEISAEKVNTSTLSNDEVKLYLEKEVNGTYEEVMAPKNFTPLSESTDLGTMAGTMLLDSGTVSETSTINYRLRMWVDENTEKGELEKTFEIRVSIKATVDLSD